jgi:hypothetical protein
MIHYLDLDLDVYVEETNSGFNSTVVECAIDALLLFKYTVFENVYS